MIRIEERITQKVPGETSLFVTFDFQRIIVDELKLLPNCFYHDKTKEWEVPLTCLAELLDRINLYDEITLQLLPYQIPTQQVYSLDEYKITPFPHQLEAIQWAINQKRGLLLDMPGLGKTGSMIWTAQELRKIYGIDHCLVICGINTLKMNWLMEINKLCDLDATILGSRINKKGNLVVDGVPKRVEHLKRPIEEFFVITNIETLRSDEIIKAINKGPNKFDMIVLDEAHTCKSCESQQGRNLLKLKNATFKIAMTGTLLLNSPFDCYMPLKWIGQERSTFSNYKYYYGNFGGPFNNILQGYKNLGVLKHQLSRCSLRRTKDILNLPDKTIINEFIEMNPQQEQFYENIKKGIIDQVDLVTMNTASLLGCIARFRQATALPQMLTSENIESSKIERAIDLASQLIESGEKVVIFSTFKAPVYELMKKLAHYSPLIGTGDQEDYEVETAKEMFQTDPTKKLFIGTWQKCGTGITLNAASYMIFIDTPYTAGVYEQAQDRIHRIGTKRPVFIYNLITKNTIDERVLEIVEDKKAISDYVIDNEITQTGLNSLRKYITELM